MRRLTPGPLPDRLRPPPGALALALASLVCVVTWAFVVPVEQAPDEGAHVAYVQSLVERGERPAPDDAVAGTRHSTEELLLREAARVPSTLGRIAARPEWREAAEARWRVRARTLAASASSDGGGPNPAAQNLPGYYALVAVGYVTAEAAGAELDGRILAMRLVSGLLLLVAVGATWSLIGLLVARDRLLQLAGTSVVALAPMLTFTAASVNPEIGLVAATAVALLAAARLVLLGRTRRRVGMLVAAVLLAVAMKPSGLALVVPTVVVVGGLLMRTRRPDLRVTRRAAAGIAGAALVAFASALVVVSSPGAAASYLSQFYLPRLPSSFDYFPQTALPAWEIWHVGAWGAFGSLEVRLPFAVYAVLAAAQVTVVVGVVRAVRSGVVRLDPVLLAALAAFAAAVLGGLHLFELRRLVDDGEPVLQGRYLLLLAPLAAIAVAVALRALAPARRAVAAALVPAGLVVLQLLSLGTTVDRFHA